MFTELKNTFCPHSNYQKFVSIYILFRCSGVSELYIAMDIFILFVLKIFLVFSANDASLNLLKFVNMNHQKYTKFTDLNNASGYKIFQPVNATLKV